jgi:hypothetical protein
LSDAGINALHSALYNHSAPRPPQIRAAGLVLRKDTIETLQNSRLCQFLFIGEQKVDQPVVTSSDLTSIKSHDIWKQRVVPPKLVKIPTTPIFSTIKKLTKDDHF